MTTEEQLNSVVQELRIAVATLQVTVQSLAGILEVVQATQVTREAHDALKDVVKVGLASAAVGVDRNDARWSRLAWFVGLIVLAAVVGLVIGEGPVKP